jgi:hypothetical protein
MTTLRIAAPLVLAGLLICPRIAVASAGSTLIKAISKQFAKEGGEDAATKISKEVGEELFERVATKAGSESIEKIGVLTAKHGPDVIRALDNSPLVKPVLAALDELPPEVAGKAVARLAAGPQGKELAETTARFGTTALRSEVRHPGIGGKFVKALGGDGGSLCDRLTTDQAISVGRHLDEIASLPTGLRQDLLKLIGSQSDRFVTFLGRFIEQNPTGVLFTAATTPIILDNSERILGGDEIVIGADGVPQVVSKQGIVGKAGGAIVNIFGKPVSYALYGIATIGLLFAGGFAAIKLWGVGRKAAASAKQS